MGDLLLLFVGRIPGPLGLILAGLSAIAGGVLGVSSGVKGFVIGGVLMVAVGIALVLIGFWVLDRDSKVNERRGKGQGRGSPAVREVDDHQPGGKSRG